MKYIKEGTEFLDQLKDSVHDLYDENKELKKEIERLQEENTILKQTMCDNSLLINENALLKDTISKAIEYIEDEIKEGRSKDNQWLMGCYDEDKRILKILKGEENKSVTNCHPLNNANVSQLCGISDEYND